jgi:hypothetical protein
VFIETINDETTIMRLLNIAELLVQHGANPNTYLRDGSRKWTTLSIVDNTFMIWVPSQAIKLRQILVLAGARSEPSSMDKLKSWRKRSNC